VSPEIHLVELIKDLLEFPCFQSLHETLQKSKVTRWELYSFVRYLLSLDMEVSNEDIHDWFQQYPWYDRATTEYQVNYERQQQMADGKDPMPIGCNNENRNWAGHCIGRENCEYSLYHSVELDQKIYDRLDSYSH